MKIYTSYFGNMKKVEKEGLLPVSIALYPPSYFLVTKYPQVREFAPTGDMIHMEWTKYVEEFEKRVLGKLNPIKAFNYLKVLSSQNGGRDVCLLCFEKSDQQCHRRLVAEWLSMNLNIVVEELRKKEPPQEPSLF